MPPLKERLIERATSIGDVLSGEPAPDRIYEVAAQVGQLLTRYGELTTNPGDAQGENSWDSSEITLQSRLYRRIVVTEPGFTWRSVTTITLPVYEHPIQHDNVRLTTTNDVTQESRFLYHNVYCVGEEGDEERNNMPASLALSRLKKARKLLRREEKRQRKFMPPEDTGPRPLN